jgi:hypothetical protein
MIAEKTVQEVNPGYYKFQAFSEEDCSHRVRSLSPPLQRPEASHPKAGEKAQLQHLAEMYDAEVIYLSVALSWGTLKI